MTFRFIYEPEYSRIIFACMMDARVGTPLANKTGIIQKEFIDVEINKVTTYVIPYRIESELGVMVGFFSILVSNMGTTASIYQIIIRPAFQSLKDSILEKISTFITNNQWQSDYL